MHITASEAHFEVEEKKKDGRLKKRATFVILGEFLTQIHHPWRGPNPNLLSFFDDSTKKKVPCPKNFFFQKNYFLMTRLKKVPASS